MSKLIILSFISLDGVMQAPGGPTEDPSGEFKLGGWTVPYFDEVAGQIMGEQMSRPSALLLGRKTYEIFAHHWPQNAESWPGIDEMTKYVVSTTLQNPEWQNTVVISTNVLDEIKKLKEGDGPDLYVHGSCTLIHTLLQSDLIDELWLKTFPVVLGKGKRLFGSDAMPTAFKLVDSTVTPTGVIFANYQRAGQVTTGSF